ncbi:class C sortase [Jeotgalibaca sp. MA1X17-3]|uniref:class C sortase n=1 Tax=Jeotgalibaca sp. MA1X17-3 TaxID=2908211 RepID=UPI001F344167|nr:class C sortase [Jeotgalibaca sp. MA1X17-3]UJF16297.1 class C sortase [Jeotgalibaca sp. MA1X17-3]
MAKNQNKKRMPVIIIFLFLIGVLVMIYPLISRSYYDYRGNEEVNQYQEELIQLPSAEVMERLQLGYAYNNALLSNENISLGDPFNEEEKEEGVSAYGKSLEISEKIGTLTIPKIHMKFPVYAGTAEAILQKGVGHMEGTSLPIGGLSTHSVLTAHRGLPENKLFTDLDQVEIGDLFFIETIAGELAYKVIEIKVIDPTEIGALSIEKDKDLVTLLTCTPYMINSHRLLAVGERTEVPKEAQEEATDISWWDHVTSLLSEYLFIIAIALLAIILFIVRQIWKRKGRD